MQVLRPRHHPAKGGGLVADGSVILETASPSQVKDALVHLAMAYQHAGDLENARACALRRHQRGVL